MLHEYFQKNDLNSVTNTFDRPLKDLMELNARALQNFSFMPSTDLFSSKKPEDMMGKNLSMIFDNGRTALSYMNNMLNIIERNWLNSMESMTKRTASLSESLKHTPASGSMMTEPMKRSTSTSKSSTVMSRSLPKKAKTPASKTSITLVAKSGKTLASKSSKTSTSKPTKALASKSSKTSTLNPSKTLAPKSSKTSTSKPSKTLASKSSKTSTSKPSKALISKASWSQGSKSATTAASKPSKALTSKSGKTLSSKSNKAPAYKSGVMIKSGSAKSTVVKTSSARTSPVKKTSAMNTPAMKGKSGSASEMKKLTTTVSSPMPSSANQPVMKDMGIQTGSKGTI